MKRESGLTPALAVRTVQLIAGVKLITKQMPVTPVLRAKKEVLDWENKKVTAHRVSIITPALTEQPCYEEHVSIWFGESNPATCIVCCGTHAHSYPGALAAKST